MKTLTRLILPPYILAWAIAFALYGATLSAILAGLAGLAVHFIPNKKEVRT